MGEFDVIWTEEAARDLEDIGRFIALDSPALAAVDHFDSMARFLADSKAELQFWDDQLRWSW